MNVRGLWDKGKQKVANLGATRCGRPKDGLDSGDSEGGTPTVDETVEETYAHALALAQAENMKLGQQLRSQADDSEAVKNALKVCQSDLSCKATELDSARQRVNALEKETEAAKNKINSLHNAQRESLRNIESLDNELQSVESEIQQLRQSHTQELGKIERKLRTTQADARDHHNALVHNHAQEVGQLSAAKKQQVSQLAQKHNLELGALHQKFVAFRDKHTQEIKHLSEDHKLEVQTIARKHQEELGTLHQQMKTSEESHGQKILRMDASRIAEIVKLKDKHKTDINTLHREVENVTQDAKTRIAQLAATHRTDKQRQVELHEKNTAHLHETVERLNAALLTNDDDMYKGELFTTSGLPANPDDKLAASFSTITQIVDSIGRLQWKQSPVIWTNEKLEKIRGDHVDRVLKKAIVQDLVWSLLHEYIFASPFRVFHEEGGMLETQWSRECHGRVHGQGANETTKNDDSPSGPGGSNSGYAWPTPDPKAERWRYITIRECRDALRPPVPSDFDPRIRLRQGFTRSLEEFQATATTALENLVVLSADDVDTLERLSKKAATVWLSFAAHRCRIVVGSKVKSPAMATSTMEEKVTLAMAMATATATAKGGGGGSALELTVVPTLGRYGNVKGTDLDSYKIIGKCAGESIVIGKQV